mgnify:CR=1 FL=1
MGISQYQIEYELLLVCEDCGNLFRYADMYYYYTNKGRKCK